MVTDEEDEEPDELAQISKEGYGGILCIETGGPTPGLGCAGRGIIATFQLLEDMELFEHYKPDVVLYDVLGDVVCGGFAAPIREGYADKVLIVTSGKEELCTDNHGRKSQIEIRTVCNQSVRITGIQVVQLVDSYDSYGYETENKHDRTQEAEDMHRLDTEFRQEPECEQVQITVDETVQSEFCLSVFSCLVVNHFFAYLAETGIFCKIRNIAVHFAIYLNVLDNLLAVSLQSTVEIVQVMDT